MTLAGYYHSSVPAHLDHAAAAEDLVDAMEPPEPFVREHPPTGAPD